MSAPDPGGTGPLAGVRVVELGGIGPVPFAATVLAELGADVVRVDRPGESNPLALAGGMRRSRRSIAVDLKHPEGVEVVRSVIARSDVVLEGFRPGVLERLGLAPDELLELNPGLVVGRLTGWGQDGPLAARAGHDITYAALSGTLHTLGPGERPVTPPPLVADFAGGSMWLVSAVLAALVSRAATGRGQVVDTAMADGAAHLLSTVHGMLAMGAWRDVREANLLDGGAPFYRVYECADGGFVAVGALEPQFWRELVAVLGVEVDGEQYDPQTWPAQEAAFSAAFRSRPRDEWAEAFADSDACVAPVLGLAEAPDHPHLAARGTFVPWGGGIVPATPPRFSGTPALPPGPEPSVGADTRAYLLDHGLAPAEIDALLASGAVAES